MIEQPLHTALRNGTCKVIDGVRRVFYDGYWIKAYDPPENTLQAKKVLIEALTRRLFNHVEHGINIPGRRLEDARRAYDAETDPERKRVKGAMLAGAMFNRATDIFTKLVELQEMGVQIDSDNALMRECGLCLHEALTLGKLVLHRSGEEGIDELWGEPFRAFSIPVEAFYESRYIKIAQTLRDIDRSASKMLSTFGACSMFEGVSQLILRFTHTAKIKCETLRTDDQVFDLWADFVVASDKLTSFEPKMPCLPSLAEQQQAADGLRLLQQGRDLVTYITRARTPMPKTTADYFARCDHFAMRAQQMGHCDG